MIVAKRKTSNIYHRMNCRYVKDFGEDILDYYDQEDSVLIGLKPCKCCCNEKKYFEEISDKLPKIFEGVTVDIKIMDHHIYVKSEWNDWRISFKRSTQMFKLWKKTGTSDKGYDNYEEVKRCPKSNALIGVMKYIANMERLSFVPEGFREYYGKLESLSKEKGFVTYLDDCNLYIITEMAAWKFKYDELKMQYKLFHHPFVSEEEKTEEVGTLYYHRQKDVPVRASFIKDVNYILDHDNAKKIMATDYRNLPKQTKKQKKYYNQAKKRERKKSTRRVLELFDKIEHEPYMCLV